MQEISAVELMAIYKRVSVVDVRELDEYVDGHVPGAIAHSTFYGSGSQQ
jgi:rhodanese-related sulfurtransferase